jgi:PadR family transcriptional regulator PadR
VASASADFPPLKGIPILPPVDILHMLRVSSCWLPKGRHVIIANKTEILQGTLDLLVLKTLDSIGTLHGFGIARRIQQLSEDTLRLNQGTLYPALVRLEQRGWIRSKWGVSANNRRARFYSLTAAGRKQLLVETESWERMTSLMARLLQGAGEA